MNNALVKEYLLDKIDSQASISIIKYCKNNLGSAGSYFHAACQLGEMYAKFFAEEEIGAEFKYIDIFQRACKCWNIDYRTWFDTMCDIVYC